MAFISRRVRGNRSFEVGVFGGRGRYRVGLDGLGIDIGVGSGGSCGLLGLGF